MMMFLRQQTATTERRRLLLVVVSLACFLGVIVAAVSRPASVGSDDAKNTGGVSLAASIVGLSSRNEGPQRFRHILDDLDDSTMGGEGHQPVVDASTLNDLQNELRRLRRPLRVLIHQLEPPATPPPPPRPSPLSSAGDDMVPADAPTPIMHRLQFHPRWKRDQTIFVTAIGFIRNEDGATAGGGGVAAHACARTIDGLFARATAPDQVHVGAVEVYENDVNLTALPPLGGCVNPEHAQCNQSAFCPTDRIRVRRVHQDALGGPQAALTLAASLFRNEAYTLLSTALGSTHRGTTDVVQMPQGWDTAYIGQVNLARTRRSVITSVARKQGGALTSTGTDAAALCTLTGTANTTLKQLVWSVSPGVNAAAAGSSAFPSALLSLDLLFARSETLRHVPLDPNVINAPAALYELSLAIRFFAKRYALLQLPNSMQPRWSRAGSSSACDEGCTTTGQDLWSHLVRQTDIRYISDVVLRATNATEHNAGLGVAQQYTAETLRVAAFWKSLGIPPERLATVMTSGGGTIVADQCKPRQEQS